MTAWRFAVAACCMLAGCSSGGGDEPASSTLPEAPPITAEPCSLLNDDAVGALSEQIERPGRSDEVSGELTCAWRNINGVAVVSLRISSVGSSSLDEEIARVGLAGDRYVAVEDVGAEAIAVFRGRASAGQGERLDRVLARRGADVVELRLPGLDIRSEADDAFTTATATTGEALAALDPTG